MLSSWLIKIWQLLLWHVLICLAEIWGMSASLRRDESLQRWAEDSKLCHWCLEASSQEICLTSAKHGSLRGLKNDKRIAMSPQIVHLRYWHSWPYGCCCWQNIMCTMKVSSTSLAIMLVGSCVTKYWKCLPSQHRLLIKRSIVDMLTCR